MTPAVRPLTVTFPVPFQLSPSAWVVQVPPVPRQVAVEQVGNSAPSANDGAPTPVNAHSHRYVVFAQLAPDALAVDTACRSVVPITSPDGCNVVTMSISTW